MQLLMEVDLRSMALKLHFIYWIKLCINFYLGAKDEWDLWISDLVKNPDGTDI